MSAVITSSLPPPSVESSHCRKEIRAMPPKSRFGGPVTVALEVVC